MPTLPSFSDFLASTSPVSNAIFSALSPITFWIVGTILGLAFIFLVIALGERVYHAVMHSRNQ